MKIKLCNEIWTSIIFRKDKIPNLNLRTYLENQGYRLSDLMNDRFLNSKISCLHKLNSALQWT